MNNKINTLIVSSSTKGKMVISELINAVDSSISLHNVASGAEARRQVSLMDYDIIIINSPLIDEIGDDLAIELSRNLTSSIALITKPDALYDNSFINNRIISIAKPLSRPLFYQLIKSFLSERIVVKKLINENIKLKNRYEELRLVSKAKCLLVEKSKITEDEAHHYIEKLAMDKRVNKSIIAMEIINKAKI